MRLEKGFPIPTGTQRGCNFMACFVSRPFWRHGLLKGRQKRGNVKASKCNHMWRVLKRHKGAVTLTDCLADIKSGCLKAYQSIARRHANFVSFFVAGNMFVSLPPGLCQQASSPRSARPIFITYGNGSFDVKLKHIVSRINLSTASSR